MSTEAPGTLELRGDTSLPTAALLISGALALTATLLGTLAGGPESAVTLCIPAAAALWLAARRRCRLVLRRDRLKWDTWRGSTALSFADAAVEIRIPPAGLGYTRTAHLPCLCLRREGQLVLSVPAGMLRRQDILRMADFFRRETDCRTVTIRT